GRKYFGFERGTDRIGGVRILWGTGLILLAVLVSEMPTLANWPHWRGPRDNGSTELGSFPVKWGVTNNVLWQNALPGKGCSTPIVWNERIYLTAPAAGQDALLAIDWY